MKGEISLPIAVIAVLLLVFGVSANLALTNVITHSLTTRNLSAGLHYYRTQGTTAVNFDFMNLRTWWMESLPAL